MGIAVFSLSVFIFVRLITVYFLVTEFIVETTHRIIGDERLPGCKYPTTAPSIFISHTLSHFLFASLSSV